MQSNQFPKSNVTLYSILNILNRKDSCFVYLHFENRPSSVLKMTATGKSLKNFRFERFDPAFTDVLYNCKYINLPFTIPHIFSEVNHLLTKCGNLFFRETPESSIVFQLICFFL